MRKYLFILCICFTSIVFSQHMGSEYGEGRIKGSRVKLNTDEFDNNLSIDDDTVQKALDTLDDAGGGSADAVVKEVAQASHGFAVGDVIYFNGTIYQKADADSENTADVVGVVSTVADTGNFTFTPYGYIEGLSSLAGSNGDFLFLSETAGELTDTAPDLSKPVMIRMTSTTGFVQIQRGTIIVTDEGTSAPTTTPQRVGLMFVDTTANKVYVATGTSSSADWTVLN